MMIANMMMWCRDLPGQDVAHSRLGCKRTPRRWRPRRNQL